MSLQCQNPHGDGRLRLVRNDLDELAQKTSLLEQKALMILLINCWKSALDAEVSEIVSESLGR